MDTNKPIEKPNPREKANPVSVILWWWTLSLFKKGYSKVLGIEDLYRPLKEDKSNFLGDKLETRWFTELQKAKRKNIEPSFFKAIARTFAIDYLKLGVLCAFGDVGLSLISPILLGSLLGYFKPKPTTTYEAALYFAGGILAARMLQSISMSQFMFESTRAGGKIRIAVCSVIYRKALRLSKTALGETAPGKVVNLVANDVNRFDIVSLFLHYMWSGPLVSLIVGVMLYNQAGYAGLVGIVVIFIVVPIQAYTGTLSSKYRLQTALKTDERVRLMDEIISSVQVIKMYAWEKPFCGLIEMSRHLELNVVKKNQYIRGIYMTFGLFTTRVALYSTLMGMLLLQQDLTAEKIFVFSSFFNTIALTMSNMFVRGYAEINESLVAIRRLQAFLMFKEFQPDNLSNNLGLAGQDNPAYINDSGKDKKLDNHSKVTKDSYNVDASEAIKFDDVTAKWDDSSPDATLENINVTFEKGKFYIVIGMVGSGKSSFLSAILREINILQGDLRVNGKISYADQDSWVFGATVRQNILFGQEFDKQRYQRVVKACALVKDFEQLPQGDLTIVGERGSSLSGGQKARINLARSVYRQADIYLLDDPLSAVDAHVGKHLFEECLQRYLKGKTRVLATHQLQFIKGADAIILVDQGKIKEYTDYLELLKDYPEYESLVAAEKSEDADDKSEVTELNRGVSIMSTSSKKSDDGDIQTEENKNPTNTLEETSKGVVKGNLMLNYLKSGANFFFIYLMIFLYIFTQAIVSFNDYFMQVFLTAEESRTYYERLNGTQPTIEGENKLIPLSEIQPRDYYITIYSAVVWSIFIVGITRSLVFYRICIRCSQRLHDFMFGALIRAAMRFFDTNPSGRILNRFSKDLGAIDEILPKVILDASQTILMAVGALIVACVINPILIAPIVVIVFFYYVIRKIYLKTSKNIKRMEGMTRSPIFTHMNATLNGISTIRAYNAESILKAEFDNLQDTHTATWYMFLASSTAYNFALDFFSFLFTALVILSFLFWSESFSGGQVGLVITQVMSSVMMIQWGMRQAAEVTNQMMSVERVLEYTQIPPESNLRDKGPMAIKDKRKISDSFLEVHQDWPHLGRIRFTSVYMRYSEEDPPVLKNLTVTIYPGEKVGIVGRTGAGKSSLISALFRIAKVDGVIEIDGIDTGKIALEDLRKSISIIPQLPVLFSGTLRRNLDPFNEYKDELLWQVLDEVELKEAVTATGNGLDHRVQDRGSNYSVGQRQLICLARAILRNNRVLMLDEATANVDPQTDALIQQTIRTKFADCTVLTVAHRLNTIMDSDKVLVMDKGFMVEYDHPHILLQNSGGQFTSLVQETGLAMYERLYDVAYNAFKNKFEIEKL